VVDTLTWCWGFQTKINRCRLLEVRYGIFCLFLEVSSGGQLGEKQMLTRAVFSEMSLYVSLWRLNFMPIGQNK